MRLSPGDVISDSIAFTGIHDLHFTRILLRLAHAGGHMIDVGANLGYFSLLWASSGLHNRVTAFEAAPRALEFLKQNVAKNRLSDRIEIRPEAVGKENGQMEFDLEPADQTGWGGLTHARSNRTHPVHVVRLDDAIRNIAIRNIALLKIDIEGADTWALLGAEALLREKRVKHIYWEQNKPRMRRLGICEAHAAKILRVFGYRPEPLGDRYADVVNWYATHS